MSGIDDANSGVDYAVCGHGGWEKLLPWRAPETAPACFYDVCVPPLLLLLSIALVACKGKAPTTAARSSRLFCVVYVAAATFAVLSHLALLSLGVYRLLVTCPALGPQCGELSGLLADSQLCLAWTVALASLLGAPGLMPSSPLRLWWIAAATASAFRAAASLPWTISWETWLQGGADPPLLAAAAAAALAAAIAALLQRSEPFPHYDPLGDASPPPEGFRSPLAGASWASVLGIGWVWPILEVGLKQPLNPAAFYCLMDSERAYNNRCLTVKLWSTRVSAWLRMHPEQRHRHTGPEDNSDSAAKMRKKTAPSLARVLHDTHALFFWSSGLLKVRRRGGRVRKRGEERRREGEREGGAGNGER